ncbi:MAG TPA: valine--tRNA ligase [Solirubrobacteraceae bacterium]|nr:valine--tRNA ligase [Solirubrobacteraceae bacterium]
MAGLQDRTRFEHATVESRIVSRWLESGLHHPDPVGTPEENFSIAIPPPNVTGALHMGHALNGSIQDTLVRWARGEGRNAKWVLGTDHAGIATQTQVERLLRSEGSSREELGREAFVERVWQWRDQYGGQIVEQYKRLGATCDYDAERFTMDEAYVAAVQKVFVELYEQGLIYRDNYLVNWDPGSGSAISDLEVEQREGVRDTLYKIRYSDDVVVATVRPETLLADTAVAVHPDDERYRHLIGTTVTLPLVGRELPVIADEHVDREFGTGCLKITPGHDPNDFEIGRMHGLEQISVIGEDGLMTEQAGRFAGLTPAAAQEAVVAALDAEGLIVGREEYVHTVPYSHRSGERIEPLISLQWFMRMDELAPPAIDAVTSGRVRIHPPSQSRRYVDWLEGIRPWCVSRQLWWGHQLPVWYRADETYVGLTPPEGDGWERDPDVLDTWFSSALWPFATLGWPSDTAELRAFYPTDVMVTARDILFLWVARMVMMGLRFTGDIPFSDVYVHSVIQAPDGRRMSKSLGTGIDPLAEIDAHGADAVRFGLLAMSSTQDVRYSAEKIRQGQALANKLFNATRFVLLNVDAAEDAAPRPATVEDRWILSRLQRAKADAAERIEAFDFAKLAFGLYDFVYGELCDWYLELVKGRPFDADLSATLRHVLRETLLLAHPVIPFVTEELWDSVAGTDGQSRLLAQTRRDGPDGALIDERAEAEIGDLIETVRALRAWREETGTRDLLVARANGPDATRDALARLGKLEWGEPGGELVRIGSLEVPAPAVDTAVVEAQRSARRAELEQEIARAAGKLANDGFVAKAPEAVVAAERDKLEQLRAELGAL